MRPANASTVLLCLTLLGNTALAAEGEQWALCGAPLIDETTAPEPTRGDAGQAPVRITSESARYNARNDEYLLQGDPVLTRGERTIAAERLRYNRTTGIVDADGELVYREPGVVMEGTGGRFRPANATGETRDVRYRISAGHLHGSADFVVFEEAGVSRYEGVRLTTCAPGDEDWWLNASTLTIDREARQGQAYNAWLEFWNVPLFYTPWIRFPVGSERLTGLLAPSAGRSDEGGAEFSLPFYWNIAPNQDATITPTWYSRRGGRLDLQYRYLLPWLDGEIDAGGLPEDRVTGESRWAIQQTHRLQIGDHLSGRVEHRRVSDTEYPSDFGDNLEVTSVSHLESLATFQWTELDWRASVLAQDWQTIDPNIAPANRPYARQPQIDLVYRPAETVGPFEIGIDAAAVAFDHPAPDQRVTGRRLDLTPSIALPLRTLGYYVEPRVAWRETRYELDATATTSAKSPRRGLPVASLDTGLYLERNTSPFGADLLQTLEPRLFYLYAPERDQDDLPLFDTGEAGFSYSQLFRPSRFTGPDRVGDANQLTAGLTSRLLAAATGREIARISLAQIRYFDERNVTLGAEPETDNESDVAGELRVSPVPELTAALDFRVDPDRTANREVRTRLRWQDRADRVLNLGYRLRRTDGVRTLEQADASFALPLGASVSLYGGVRYDAVDRVFEERFAGLEYNSCCYAVRLVHRRYLGANRSADAEISQQILVELELKGLGGVGDRIVNFLDGAIDGYRPRRY